MALRAQFKRGYLMAINFPEFNVFGPPPFEAFAAATGWSGKAVEAIATETMDYSKKSFEKSRALFEKLMGVKKIDEAFQLQTDFAKSVYEDFVAQAAKIGEIYSSLAREAFKPISVASPGESSVVATPSKAPVAAKQSAPSAD